MKREIVAATAVISASLIAAGTAYLVFRNRRMAGEGRLGTEILEGISHTAVP